MTLKPYELQDGKEILMTYVQCTEFIANGLKFQNQIFGCHKTLTLKFGYFGDCGSTVTLLACRYHKNRWSMMLL